ncbi:GyrI-like domain-containing protein [Paenibacillus apis]|nr:GyrI-like domain-containing protein [Paenibacillus apis]
MKWIPEHGFVAKSGIYYHYLNDEEQPQNEYLTEMYIPVEIIVC